MLRAPLFFVALALFGAALSCAPATHMTAVWTDHSLNAVAMQRPLVVFQHTSEALRRSIEDGLAAQIPGAVQGYRVIDTGDVANLDAIKSNAAEGGFDTLVLARLLDVDVEVEILGPSYTGYGFYGPYGPLWGGWGGGWSGGWAPYGPVAMDENTIVSMESLVYTLEPRGDGVGELVWASRSTITDPRSAEDIADTVLLTSLSAMQDRGLVAASTPVPTEKQEKKAMGR